MIVHKILRGENAARYLPYALHRLRSLNRQKGDAAYFSEWSIVEDHHVQVQQIPPSQYIRITAGAPRLRYEFFTSEHVRDDIFATPGHSFHVCGSATRALFKTTEESVKVAGRWSSVYTPDDDDAWVLRDCESGQSSATQLYTWRAWQNQKFFEHVWWPKNNGLSAVTSTQAQAPGLAGQCNWMSPYAFARIASAGSKVSDFGADVLPTLMTSTGSSTGAPQLSEPWAYWRRAAVQTVNGRRFFISTDNYGRFQVYPVKNYNDTNGLVPADGYKQYTPSYPSWVTVPDPGDYRWQVNDWLWRFNKDATKCVSIPYSSDFSNGFYKTLANQAFFATILPAQIDDVVLSAALVPAHEDTPGLVEFGIEIALTGDGDMDFEVTFTLLRNEHFDEPELDADRRFFFDVAYYLPDADNFGVPEDALITAEIEAFYPAGLYLEDSGESPSPYHIDLIRNMKADVVINAHDGALDDKVEILRFTAMTAYQGKFETVAGCMSNLPGATHGLIGGPVQLDSGTVTLGSAGPISYLPELDVNGFAVGGIFARIYALELSTLSILYSQSDEVAGTGFVRGMSYGTEFYRFDFDLGFTKSASLLAAPDTRVPTARLHQFAIDTTINTEWGQGFSVSPLGHWALMVNAELQSIGYGSELDWISVKGKDEDGNDTRYRYRHKTLFNDAFGQTRDYSFYTEPFTGKVLWDQGSFRTQGIWVTWR